MSSTSKQAGDAPRPETVDASVVDESLRLTRLPRAQAQIRAAKGWAGIGGFVLTLYLALQAGLPAFDACVRALVFGVALYLVAWMAAIVVWRQLALARVETARRRFEDERDELLRRLAEEASAAAESGQTTAG